MATIEGAAQLFDSIPDWWAVVVFRLTAAEAAAVGALGDEERFAALPAEVRDGLRPILRLIERGKPVRLLPPERGAGEGGRP